MSLDGVVGMVQLREAIASVALSHEADCSCTVCRAAAGDSDALVRMLLRQSEEGDRR